MTNGERLCQARELLGLTQAELATRIGVTQGAIARIENHQLSFSDEVVQEAAKKLHLPLEFFFKDDPPLFPLGSLLYRGKASLVKRAKFETHMYAQIGFELAWFLLSKIKPIPISIKPSCGTPPVEAAHRLRKLWNLAADEPIANLIHQIELSGALVLPLPTVDGCEAFSVWAEDFPVLAINLSRPGDRQRLTIGHELAHLLLHRKLKPSKRLENEAFEFAAELLMPTSAMQKDIVPPVTISRLAALKPKWRVSLQALIRRAKDLTIVSERQYRYLFEQMSVLGWRTQEPPNLDIPTERPRLLKQAAEVVYGKPINYERLASETSLPATLVREIISEYADGADRSGRDLVKAKVISIRRA